MLRFWQQARHQSNCAWSFYFKYNQCQLQKPIISFNRYFTETSTINDDNQLPDPHALVQDPDDPSGKTRYNTDNDDEFEGDGIVTDEQFVEGMIVAMEEHCPDVRNITEEQKKDMVSFVERHKHIRLRK